MTKHAIGLYLLILHSTFSHAQQVYKWTDAQGKTHYGDVLPEGAKPATPPAVITIIKPTESQRAEALARAAKEKAQLQQQNEQAAASAAPSAAKEETAEPAAPANSNESCEAQWQKFNDSYACFDPYRLANGTIRAEGYEQCAEVKMPDKCKY